MPAGVSWPRYLGAITGALVSMFAGAQAVHLLYDPLKDLEAKVEMEKENLRKTSANMDTAKVATT